MNTAAEQTTPTPSRDVQSVYTASPSSQPDRRFVHRMAVLTLGVGAGIATAAYRAVGVLHVTNVLRRGAAFLG